MRHPSRRRGQADSLIGILVLLFVFFILFLPPGVRQELLEDNDTDDDDDDGYDSDGPVFIEVTPGLLTPEGLERTHAIPSFLLLETASAALLASNPGFTVSRGWFVNRPQEVQFSLREPGTVDNALLSFQAGRREGILRVLLNGQPIFQGQLSQASPAPISLPGHLLQERNVLSFEASGVGLAFWRQNDYDLGDVQVVGDISDRSRQAAQNLFVLGSDEFVNPESVGLVFRPSCDPRAVGTLEVELNGRIISSSVPICDSQNRIDLKVDSLRSGENTLVFRSLRGSFEVTGISVRVRLREGKAFTRSFEIDDDVADDVIAGRKRVRLIIDFRDDEVAKRAEVRFNTRSFDISQRNHRWDKDVSEYVRHGTNTVEIRPLNDLSVDRLQVRLE